MLGAIAGSGRLPLTAEQLEAAIRADGKSVEGNLRGFRAGLDAARAKAAPAKTPDKKRNAPTTPALLEHEVDLLIARAGAGDRDRGHTAADRLSKRRLCAALSRPAARSGRCRRRRRHAGQVAQGGRAPARGAHVLRGRGAGGAGQDLARAHAPHRARGIARAGRAVLGARFPQARHRGTDPIAAAVAGAPHTLAQRAARLARPRLFRHGDQFHLDQRILALSDARQAAPAAAARLSLQAGTGADRILARPDRRGRHGIRAPWRSKSPNAPA